MDNGPTPHENVFSFQHSHAMNKATSAMPSAAIPQNMDSNGTSMLRFVVVDHPDKLRDRKEMRENRVHVMHDWLDKERRKPRAMGSLTKSRTKRNESDASSSTGTSINMNAPTNIFAPRRSDSIEQVSPRPAVASSRKAQNKYGKRPAVESDASPERNIERVTVTRRPPAPSDGDQPLVSGIASWSARSAYMKAKAEEIPYPIDGQLEPFGVWPTFSNPTLNLNQLKFSCSQRFGSRSLARHWVPVLLRARHAFLSTLCISSAHDAIMSQTLLPDHSRGAPRDVTRWSVKHDVISMVSDSMKDCKLAVADETIVSVLQLLHSDIIDCDHGSMRVHQDGLRLMVMQRGGLAALGVGGHLANMLTITMHMLAALQETPIDLYFADFASRQDTRISHSLRSVPESPIYCRSSGFQTVARVFQPHSATLDLLNTVRHLGDAFDIQRELSPAFDRSTSTREPGDQDVSALCNKVFSFQAAVDEDFDNVSERYTYEAIRLTSRVYAHALTRKMPFSQAAIDLQAWSALFANSDDACLPLPVQIKLALMRTDMSVCWGHMAGVLFWVALVASAAASSKTSQADEDVGSDEDTQRFLAAITVRCCIVLSFEHGSSVLGTLKRLVNVQNILAGAETGSRIVSTDAASTLSSSLYGPLGLPGLQRGFVDYAQEFLEM